MDRFTYIRPKSVDDALAHLDSKWGETYLLAGGTDLVNLMRERLITPKRVVSLKSIPGLKKISYTPGDGLHIGAGATIAGIASHPEISLRFPVLAQAARAVATPQLRNMGTLGGNLMQRPKCWYYRSDYDCFLKDVCGPCYAVNGENRKHALFGDGPCFAVHGSDMAVALQALQSRIKLLSRNGERILSMAEFYTTPTKQSPYETVISPDEIIMDIHVPDIPLNVAQKFFKVKEHGEWHTPLASLAVVLRGESSFIESANVILGGVAPKPWQAESAEFVLMGSALTESVAEQAGSAAIDGARSLKDNKYKLTLVRNIVRDTILELAQKTSTVTA